MKDEPFTDEEIAELTRLGQSGCLDGRQASIMWKNLPRLLNERAVMVEDIKELQTKNKILQHRCFRVQDSNLRLGWCYSFYDHFHIHWDDGVHQMQVIELSVIGVRKAAEAGGDNDGR